MFVRRSRGPAVRALLILAASAPAAAGQVPIEVGGDSVRISTDPEWGLPVEVFLKIMARLTEREWRCHEGIAKDKAIVFTGTVTLTHAEIEPFARALLYRVGLACVESGKRIDVVPGESPSVAALKTAQCVPIRNLDSMRTKGAPVLTAARVPRGYAVTIEKDLRKAAPPAVEIGHSGDEWIILQGPAFAVHRAAGKVRELVRSRGSAGFASFRRLVPRSAVAAAEFAIPARDALGAILGAAMGEHWRDRLDRSTQAEAATSMVILGASLEPEVGIILQPNERTEDARRSFPVRSDRKAPQWAAVFRIRRNGSDHLLHEPAEALQELLSRHRSGFRIGQVHRLGLDGPASGTAFEYSIEQMPGTGALSIGIVGDHLVIANSGSLLLSIARSTSSRSLPFRDPPKKQGVQRGRVWTDGDAASKLLAALGLKLTVQQLELGELRRWLDVAFGN